MFRNHVLFNSIDFNDVAKIKAMMKRESDPMFSDPVHQELKYLDTGVKYHILSARPSPAPQNWKF